MLKLLIKKQLFDLNRGFFQDRKTGKLRSRTASITLIVLYALLVVVAIGGIFAYMAYAVCAPLVATNMGWLYFSVMSLMAIALGVFGSVFNTFSGLYQAKDNDLLLSMPIPVRYILASRLLGVYLMGLMFSALVMVPAVIVYFVTADFRLPAVLGSVILIAAVSVVVLVLSCALGWVVAKINNKLRNKSLITVIVSLAFLGLYYVAYFKANELLQSLIANAATVGSKIKASAYPLYMIGRVGEGDAVSVLVTVAAAAALLAVTYLILSKSFLRIATGGSGAAKRSYKKKSAKAKGVNTALLRREAIHLVSSPVYMLNCSLGTLLIVAAAVAVLIKGAWLSETMTAMLSDFSGYIPLAVCAMLCLLASMNDITAPSVSLEGKSIWLVQSLPVTSWQALRAKLGLHIILTAIPTVICGICTCAVLRMDPATSLLVMIMPLIYIVFYAALGLVINLKMPNLNWTSEVVAVKQSMGVLIALFTGWFYILVLGGGFYLLRNILSANAFLAASAALTAVLSAVIIRWLKTAGSRIFERL